MSISNSLIGLTSTLLMYSVVSFGQLRPLPPGQAFPPNKPGDGMRGQIEARLSNLEMRAYQTEQQLNMALNKINSLENLLTSLNPLPPPTPIYNSKISCMLVDTGYSKTFLGSGRNNLEAEIEARQACGNEINASYCKSEVKCSDGQNTSPYGTGFLCMIIDSGYGRTYKGEGLSLVEAEANAKIACQSEINPRHCGKVTARCEVVR